MSAPVPTCAADLDDQRWLDRQVDAIEGGAEAVVAIARNWDGLRNLSRLHPGTTWVDYIRAHAPSLALGRDDVPLLLRETALSNRVIAELAGVSPRTVNRVASEANASLDRGPTVGADGRARRYEPPAPRPEGVPTDGGLVITPAHARLFPDALYEEMAFRLHGEIRAFARVSKWVPGEWADRVRELRPAEVEAIRSEVRWVRRRIEAWEALIDGAALVVVEGGAR